MHNYIERIINITGDKKCSFRIVSALLGKGEEDHTLVHHQLIKELKGHKESYTRLYGTKINYDAIYESLVSCMGGPVPEDKWTRFREMSYLIENAYEKCVLI